MEEIFQPFYHFVPGKPGQQGNFSPFRWKTLVWGILSAPDFLLYRGTKIGI